MTENRTQGVLFSVSVTPMYSHRVHSLQALERLSQPSSHDDGKPGDDDGKQYTLCSMQKNEPHPRIYPVLSPQSTFYGSTIPICASISSRALGEKSAVIVVMVSLLTKYSRCLYSNEIFVNGKEGLTAGVA